MRLVQVASRGEGPHCPAEPPCPISACFLSLPCWWNGYKEQSWGWRGSLTNERGLGPAQCICSIGGMQEQLRLVQSCSSPVTLISSYGFHLADDSWGPNGSHQWVADFRHHKCWMPRVYWIYYEYLKPQVPHVYLVSHKYLMPLGLSSLSMFSTHMLSLLYLC